MRFEDEQSYERRPKQPNCTRATYPELLASQVVPFNPNLPPAVFPSRSLDPNAAAQPEIPEPSNRAAEHCSSDEAVDSDADDTSIEDDDDFRFELQEAAWEELETSVKYAIWTHLARDYAPDDVAALLQLTPEQFWDIRQDVYRRQQCPIDSSNIIHRLNNGIDDPEGILEAAFQPHLLIAQTYEFASTRQVRLGLKLLEQLGIPSHYMGAWHMDGGDWRAIPDILTIVVDQQPAELNDDLPPSSPEPRPDSSIIIRQSELPDDRDGSPAMTTIDRPIIGKTEIVRAHKRKHHQQEQRRTEQKRFEDRIQDMRSAQNDHCADNAQVPFVASESSPVPALSSATITKKPLRRPIILKYGTDPNTIQAYARFMSSYTMQASSPLQMAASTQGKTLRDRAMAPERALGTSSMASSPAARSSGSMSLRDPSRLRKTTALIDFAQFKDFLEADMNDRSPESDQGVPAQPLSNSKPSAVNLRINNKSARASVFRGDEKVENYPFHASDFQDSPDDSPDDTLHDHPQLFDRNFTSENFPVKERERLCKKPFASRSLEEMWVIYGRKAWSTQAPWNAKHDRPLFDPLPQGRCLDPTKTDSMIGAMLLNEWNRYQSDGIGQDVLETTAAGILLLAAQKEQHTNHETMQQMIEGDNQLRSQGHSLQNFDHKQVCLKVQQELWLNVAIKLDCIYDGRFAELEIVRPSRIIQIPTPGRGSGSLPASKPSRNAHSSPKTASANIAVQKDFGWELIRGTDPEVQQPLTPSVDDFGIFDTDDDNSPSIRVQLRRMKSDSSFERSTSGPRPRNSSSGGTAREGPLKEGRKEQILNEEPPRTSMNTSAGISAGSSTVEAPKTPSRSPKAPAYSPISAEETSQAVHLRDETHKSNEKAQDSSGDDPRTLVTNLIAGGAMPNTASGGAGTPTKASKTKPKIKLNANGTQTNEANAVPAKKPKKKKTADTEIATSAPLATVIHFSNIETRMTRSRSSTQTPVPEDQAAKKPNTPANAKSTPKPAACMKSNGKMTNKTDTTKNPQIQALKGSDKSVPATTIAKRGTSKETPKATAAVRRSGNPKSTGVGKVGEKPATRKAEMKKKTGSNAGGDLKIANGVTKPPSAVRMRAQAAEEGAGDGDAEMTG